MTPLEMRRRALAVFCDRHACEKLLAQVSAAHAVSEDEILGSRRPYKIMRARHDLWARLDRASGVVRGELAAVLGVDRTTLVHALTKPAAELEP